MSGRGDNNKNGTSGQGAANQSGQGMEQSDNREKMNHGKKTGGKPSQQQSQEQDQSSNRNESVKKKQA